MGRKEGLGRDPRGVLNHLRWGSPGGLGGITLWILNRNVPGGFSTVPGGDVVTLGRSFFDTARATIPYHRVYRITRGDDVLYARPGVEAPAARSS